MTLRLVWHYLRQADAEQDEGFRREILRQAHAGLRVLGIVGLCAPLVIFLTRTLVANRLPPTPAVLIYLAIVVIGGITFGLARMPGAARQARLLGWLVAFACGVLVIVMGLLEATAQPAIVFSIGGRVVVVLMIALFSLPLHPLQTLSLGVSLVAVFLVASQVVVRSNLLAGLDAEVLLELVAVLLVIVLLSTALSANSYQRLSSSYRSHQDQLRAAEELRQTQARVLVSENAASMGRFAAALSHELNSPAGALTSSIDTIRAITEKRATATVEKQGRLLAMEEELCSSARQAADRLHETITRMQRLTNLDRAEILLVDVNQLLRDVAAMVDPESQRQVKIEFEFEPLPQVKIRPQQISAVFSALLHNSLRTMRGAGRVLIVTRQAPSHIEAKVHDNGQGFSADELARIFDPVFLAEKNRMAAGNWGLFSSREIVRQHGGDIEIKSSPGKGTTVWVRLPV